MPCFQMATLTFRACYVPDAVYTSSLFFHHYLEGIVIISSFADKETGSERLRSLPKVTQR